MPTTCKQPVSRCSGRPRAIRLHLREIRKKWLWALLLPILAQTAPAAVAAGWEPVESIRAAALSTVGDRDAPGVTAEALVDPSLRLPACDSALAAEGAALGAATVSCRSLGWQVRIPLRVRRLQPVVVLARTVDAGAALSADALRIEWRDSARLAGAVLGDPAAATGRIARRTLPAGSVLAARDITAVPVVRRGDSVTLVSRRGGVEVRVAARAMADAAASERLSVENLSSRRIVQGVLGDDGEVRLP